MAIPSSLFRSQLCLCQRSAINLKRSTRYDGDRQRITETPGTSHQGGKGSEHDEGDWERHHSLLEQQKEMLKEDLESQNLEPIGSEEQLNTMR